MFDLCPCSYHNFVFTKCLGGTFRPFTSVTRRDLGLFIWWGRVQCGWGGSYVCPCVRMCVRARTRVCVCVCVFIRYG